MMPLGEVTNMYGRYCYLLRGLVGLLLICQPFVWGYKRTDLPITVDNLVRFDLYQDYLIVAHGNIGLLKGLNFLLDTGTNPSILDRRVARKLHLDELPADISVLEGSLRGGTALLPSLEFGPIRKQNFPVVIHDLSFLQRSLPVHVDAVIGMDVLGKSSFVVDYSSRMIQFGSYSPLPISVPFCGKAGLAVIEAELNHTPIHLMVDTGAPSLIIFETRLPAAATTLKVGDVRKATNMVGQVESRQVRLNSLRLGDEELRQRQAFVVQDRNSRSRDFDGLISPPALGFTRVSVDLERGLMGFGK